MRFRIIGRLAFGRQTSGQAKKIQEKFIEMSCFCNLVVT